MNFPASVNKRVFMLCSHNRIKHYGIVAAGRIFHSYGNTQPACRKTMLLVFNRTRTDSNISKKIVKVLTIEMAEKQISGRTIGLSIDYEDVLSADTFNKVLLKED